MSIDEQKILIAKYLGLITETDGLWYLDNTHELKYDEDWNWIISAYKQIKKIEFEKIGTTDRIGDILRGIFNADIYINHFLQFMSMLINKHKLFANVKATTCQSCYGKFIDYKIITITEASNLK